MLFGVSLPVVGNGEGFLPGHSRVPEAFLKGQRGQIAQKWHPPVAMARKRHFAMFCYFLLLLLILT